MSMRGALTLKICSSEIIIYRGEKKACKGPANYNKPQLPLREGAQLQGSGYYIVSVHYCAHLAHTSDLILYLCSHDVLKAPTHTHIHAHTITNRHVCMHAHTHTHRERAIS